MSAHPATLLDRPAVLVVDDDESIRAMLVDILEREGYRVMSARDGMEALAAIEREIPLLILLDVRMPLLDGRSLAMLLRERGPRIPVVLMTASDPAAVSYELHADAYLAKPFELSDLLVIAGRFRAASSDEALAEV